jgi:hypothetical protein
MAIYNEPHRLITIENDITIPKPRSKYTDGDKKLFFMDVIVINTLYCALSRSKFNRISSCKDAKDIWHTLEVTHEGINQVEESKIDMLVH